jgi:hypothetical protein
MSQSLRRGAKEEEEILPDIKRRRVRGADWGDESDEDLDEVAQELELLKRLDNSGRLYAILACMRRVRSTFQAVCPLFVLKTLLYEALVVGIDGKKEYSATEVDIGIEKLKENDVVVALYLPSMGDFALLETEEYISVINRVLLKVDDPKLKKAGRFLLDELIGKQHGPTIQLPKGSNRGEQLDILVKQEFLLRIPTGSNAPAVDVFGLKVPGSGQLVRSAVEGRTELASKIRRKKHGEMLVSKIRKEVKLKKSSLGLEWHIADLVGSGLVHVVPTTVGPLLRLLAHD